MVGPGVTFFGDSLAWGVVLCGCSEPDRDLAREGAAAEIGERDASGLSVVKTVTPTPPYAATASTHEDSMGIKIAHSAARGVLPFPVLLHTKILCLPCCVVHAVAVCWVGTFPPYVGRMLTPPSTLRRGSIVFCAVQRALLEWLVERAPCRVDIFVLYSYAPLVTVLVFWFLHVSSSVCMFVPLPLVGWVPKQDPCVFFPSCLKGLSPLSPELVFWQSSFEGKGMLLVVTNVFCVLSPC